MTLTSFPPQLFLTLRSMCSHGQLDGALNIVKTSFGYLQTSSYQNSDLYHEEVDELGASSLWTPRFAVRVLAGVFWVNKRYIPVVCKS